jgi:hypothetical protein
LLYRNNEIFIKMKSKVFKNAWELVKTMGITLSLALSIAWQEAKIDNLGNRLIVAQSKAFNYKEEKAIETEMSFHIRKVNEIKPCYVNFAKPDNSGAAYYYGVGRYNGD